MMTPSTADAVLESLPESLTEIVPYDTAKINIPTWKVVHNIENDTIEFTKNDILNKHVILVVLLLWVLCGIIIALGVVYSNELPKGAGLFIVCVGSLLVFSFGIAIPLLYALVSHLNSLYWNGKLRFRYNRSTGDMFFSRERKTYQRSDRNRLVLGYTQGYDTRYCKEFCGLIVSQGKRNTCPIVQFYILICNNNGEWTRHTLATDLVTLTMKSAIDALGKSEIFETVYRKMTLRECYEKQRTATVQGDSSDPEP